MSGPLRVLVGCETSGVVRRAFAARGHDAWSCDLLPAEDRSNRHIIGDIRHHLCDGWDLLAVMHPPCTRLCNSGVRWLHVPPKGKSVAQMWADLDDAVDLFSACLNAPIPYRALENPVMHRHARERITGLPKGHHVQPWWFGDPFFKSTGLYLVGLPPLRATDRLTPPQRGTPEHRAWSAIHRASPGPDCTRFRSRTFPGIAQAMADQWGSYAVSRMRAAA
ncbi:MAG TPA: hypothetical protein PLS93_02575 [Accumulibacter sp.]|nr:hypothetical protein [Accumulibacter sp.]